MQIFYPLLKILPVVISRFVKISEKVLAAEEELNSAFWWWKLK